MRHGKSVVAYGRAPKKHGQAGKGREREREKREGSG